MGWLAEQFENGSLMRRIVLFWAMVIVTFALYWSTTFSDANPDSVNTALILAAIWAPLNLMFGHIFSKYTKTRTEK